MIAIPPDWIRSAIATHYEWLRAQAEHFKRLLELKSQVERHPEMTSFVLLGFARENEERPVPLCAVTWKGLTAMPADVRIQGAIGHRFCLATFTTTSMNCWWTGKK